MDRVLVERLGGAGAQIVILPTAATNENPYVAGENGVRHFRRLGARPDKLMIVDADSANDAGLVGLIEDYAGLYFTSGDPIYLRATLLGSKTWPAVEARARRCR